MAKKDEAETIREDILRDVVRLHEALDEPINYGTDILIQKLHTTRKQIRYIMTRHGVDWRYHDSK